MSKLKVAALLCALASPVLAEAALPGPPEWVNRGSGAFDIMDKGKIFYAVGIASHQHGKAATEPLGWCAWFRAVSGITKILETYVSTLHKKTAATVTASASKSSAIRTFSTNRFGGIEVMVVDKFKESEQLDGGDSKTFASTALKLAWQKGDPWFSYRDFEESNTSGLSSSGNLEISFTQSKGTEALLAELRAGGLRLAGLWTDPSDGTIYALAELDMDSVWKRMEQQMQKPETAATKKLSDQAREKMRKAADAAFDALSAE